jgi:hypothetical protein
MTPFELGLASDLGSESQRFANDWLFKWHGMTYEGGLTDVDDFCGGRIRYRGLKFGHQQQQVFWQAIDRYLNLKVHETFKRWEAATEAYPNVMRLRSIDGVERNLREFIQTITQHSLRTDHALRGAENVTYFGNGPRAGAELLRLAQAHRALLDEKIRTETPVAAQLSRKQKVENFLSNHKGIMGGIGLLIGALGLARYFLG